MNHSSSSCVVSSGGSSGFACGGRCPIPIVVSTMPAAPVRVDVWPLIRFMLIMVSLVVVTIRTLSAGQGSRFRLFRVFSLDLCSAGRMGRASRVSIVIDTGIDSSPWGGFLCLMCGGRVLPPGLLLARLGAGRQPLMLL